MKIIILWIVLAAAAFGQARFWAETPTSLAQSKHTHVRVTGKVTLVKKEADGDVHIRISDAKRFIVAECIPALPCVAPKVGEMVTVYGISRLDREHGWYEVHPVEKIVRRRRK